MLIRLMILNIFVIEETCFHALAAVFQLLVKIISP